VVLGEARWWNGCAVRVEDAVDVEQEQRLRDVVRSQAGKVRRTEALSYANA
jgi:hypothetical protein